MIGGRHVRWGMDATAHQAAQPRTRFTQSRSGRVAGRELADEFSFWIDSFRLQNPRATSGWVRRLPIADFGCRFVHSLSRLSWVGSCLINRQLAIRNRQSRGPPATETV